MRYFTFFLTPSFQNPVYFILRAHLNLSQPHFKCSVASHTWLRPLYWKA